MTIRITCAVPAHMKIIGLNATRQAACRFVKFHNDSEALRRLCRTSWCLHDDDTPFGVAGYVIVRPGYAVCWAMFTEHVYRVSPIELVRLFKCGIRDKADKAGLIRIESSVDILDGVALRWARLLGFETEGLMQGSGEGNTDQWLIARIKE